MASLLVTFAAKEESRAFQKLIRRHSDLQVLLTGIGQRNAERAIRGALAEQLPKLVLTCGFAGGWNPALATGTVVLSTDEEVRSRRGTEADSPRQVQPRRSYVGG